MRILEVSHYYIPHVGGLEVALNNLVKLLVSSGHTVALITCASKGVRSGIQEEGGARVHRVRALNFLERFSIPFPIPSPEIFRAMWMSVKEVDLVHIHDVFYIPSWIAYLAARWYGKQLFVTQHVALVEHPSRLVMQIEKAVYALWGQRIFSYASRIITYNRAVRNFVSERTNPSKVLELRNGIDQTIFYPAKNAEEKAAARRYFKLPAKPLALFVGRFVHKKGIDDVFAARDDAYDLVFAGSGEIQPEWKEAAGVHILGPLPQAELAMLYRAADIFVLPSRGELFTLAMQEAAASGLPIITTDEPAYRDYGIDRDGISLIEPQPERIRASLRALFKDHDLYRRMSRYSEKMANEWFDLAKNNHAMLEVYNEFEQTRRVVTTSWDDGHVLDLRLAALLRKYGISGTFYISPENRELKPEERLSPREVRELSGFEIGAHTVTHPYLPSVDMDTAEREIIASKEIIEAWIGRAVTSFCYPKGGYTHEHQAVVKRAGYTRARTVQRFAQRTGDDPFALPTTIHVYDHWSDVWALLTFVRFRPHAFLRLYRKWDEQAKALFDRMLENGGVFHLWGHSWEIEAQRDWTRLENVLRYIAHREGVQYVANDAVRT